jgi:hypothetical protein
MFELRRRATGADLPDVETIADGRFRAHGRRLAGSRSEAVSDDEGRE